MMRLRMIGVSAVVAIGGVLSAAARTPVAYEDDEASDAKDEAEAEPEDRWFAVTGGDVYVEGGGVLRGATVLAKNGVIEEIGYELYLPDGTQVFDVPGLRVYPGLVAYSATSRVLKGSVPSNVEEEDFEVDVHEEVPEEEFLVAALRAAEGFGADLNGGAAQELGDEFDPFSSYLTFALSAGITTVGQSGQPIKLKRYELGVDMAQRGLVNLSFGSSTSRRQARERFAGAAKYLREYREWQDLVQKDKSLAEPSDKGVHKPSLEILRGTRRARFNASNRDDLLGIARLAQKYDFRPVIEGCIEGWTVAEELGRAGAFAVITPRERRARDEMLVKEGGSSIENAARLHEAGVQVAVIPKNQSIDLGGIAGRDLLHFPIEAAFAVRGGLDEASAFSSITLIPARILGVDHRVGTLAVGKDCDLMVTDGDPLHYETFVQYTIVEGKIVYDKAHEGFFSHIRPQSEAQITVVGEELDVDGEAEEGEAAEEPEAAKAEEGGEAEESSDAKKQEDEPKADDEQTEEPKTDDKKGAQAGSAPAGASFS